MRTLRRRLVRLRRKHENVIREYYSLGTSYSEPVASLLYSLASSLGREDNDLLWLAVIGVSSLELSGQTMTGVGISTMSEAGGSAGWGGNRGERIRQMLRDEVRRLNPPGLNYASRRRAEAYDMIPTAGGSPNDTSIHLSPEPRFLLIRHWSLYESMLHSPYLASRLHLWNEAGRKRLNKLLAKMGISLSQCHQTYTHMDMELKRELRQKLLKYAPMYGLDGLVPPAIPGVQSGWGFVRNWGWKASLSAVDVCVIMGAILEVGSLDAAVPKYNRTDPTGCGLVADMPNIISRFWHAYDAISPTSESPTKLLASLPLAQHLHRAILRTGTIILSKRQIRHLNSFRIAVIKEGLDVKLFTNPGALTKLALWLGESVHVQEREKGDGVKVRGKRTVGTPLVLASLDDDRGVYVVVGTGGGGGVVDFAALAKSRDERNKKAEERRAQRAAERAERENGDGEELDEESDGESDESESEDELNMQSGEDVSRRLVRNRFGLAFQEVVEETNARIRINSFEHCVVEVQKEDLGGFLEALSFRSVVA